MPSISRNGLKIIINHILGNQTRPKLFDLAIVKPEMLYEEVIEVSGRVIPKRNDCHFSPKEWKLLKGTLKFHGIFFKIYFCFYFFQIFITFGFTKFLTFSLKQEQLAKKFMRLKVSTKMKLELY